MNQYEEQKRRNPNRNNQEIEHGLGIGGGRGRPKGSRNGYISPGAAYMKDYEIVGQRADPNQPIPMNRSGMLNNYPQQSRPQPVPRNPSPRLRNNQKAAVKAVTGMTANPTRSVELGKNMLEKVIGAGLYDQGQAIGSGLNKARQLGNIAQNEQRRAAGAPAEVVPNTQDAKEQFQKAQSETPEIPRNAPEPPKSFWDGLLAWGDQAWKDISGLPTRAIDAGKAAYNAAAQWVDTAAKDVGSWMDTAYNDVSNWIGDTAGNVGKALFGYDVNQTPSGTKEGHQMNGEHVNGFFDNAGNWISTAAQNVGNAVTGAYNDATKWVGDTAGNVGKALFGYDVNQTPSGTKEGHQMNGEHVNGFFDNTGNWISTAAQNVGNAVGGAVQQITDAAGNVYNAVVDGAGNVVRVIGEGANAVGDWVGQRGEELNDWWNGTDKISGRRTVNDVYGSRENIRGDYDPNDTTDRRQVVRDEVNVEHTPGFRENAAQALSDAGRQIGNIPGNVGRALFGYDVNQNLSGTKEGHQMDGEHVNGYLDDAYNAVSAAVRSGANWTKQQIYDPVANTLVNVGDFLMGALGRPVGRAIAEGQKAIDNAATDVENKLNEFGQGVANTANEARNMVNDSIKDAQAQYNFNRMYGDARSSNMLNSGVSDNVVQGINRMAANIEITENQRDNLMDAAYYARTKGVPASYINYLYSLVESGSMNPQLFASRMVGLADMSDAELRDLQRRYK